MPEHCCAGPSVGPAPRYRRILWVALGVNGAMFAVEIGAGLAAGSVSLQADALDFLGDAANYALSLAVLGLGLVARARAALVKGVSMGLFGLWVAASTLWHAVSGTVPEAEIMGIVGAAALVANVGVAALLYAFRRGDADMRSVWLCSRNDAIGNAAVMLAASGVFATGAGWPDIAVAAIMASLALWSAAEVIDRSRTELRHLRAAPEGGRA